MNRLSMILIAGVLLGAPVFASAQSAPPLAPDPVTGISPVPFRVLDQDRLLRGSRLGQQILAGIRRAEQALEAENQQIADQLAAEESALTEARSTLTPEEFRTRADVFDTRVEQIREERAQASQALTRHSETEAQRFFDTALPILVEMMNDQGVLGLLKPDAVILGSDWLDITDAAIARLDASPIDAGDAPAPAAPEDATPTPAP